MAKLLTITIILIVLNFVIFCHSRNLIDQSNKENFINFKNFENISNFKNSKKLKESQRIIGGQAIIDGLTIPYQVSIQNTFGEHICGGSIISNEWILTAAHCLDWPIEYLKVIMGTNNWTQPYAEYNVANAIIHCLFNKPFYHNDIGLLRLSELIIFDERIQSIQLAKENTLKPGDKLLLTGWGSTKPWSYYPELLHKVELQYISHKQCAANIRNADWLSVGHLCTDTTSGVGSCNGDSGSPLVDTQLGLQVGIVNFGEPCAVGYPDAFASVSYYYDWIQNAIRGQNKC